MNNLIVWLVIIIISFIVSLMNYRGTIIYKADKDINHKEAPFSWKFFQIWNFFICFFLGGLIGYYFIAIRFKQLSHGDNLASIDIILVLIFIMSLIGYLPHFLKNITEGIQVILKRVLEK